MASISSMVLGMGLPRTRQPVSVMRLLGAGLYYDLIDAVGIWMVDGSICWGEIKLLNGWFIMAYLFLMTLAPIVNAGIDGLWAKSRQLAVSAVCLMATFVGLR